MPEANGRSLTDSRDDDDAEAMDPGDDEDGYDDEEPPPAREGLPPAFRMRHQPHYVEQLMGEGPLQTVRQIPIAEVESSGSPDNDLAALADSIRQFGILQPLVVARSRGEQPYRLIAGANRLAAARLADLATVPGVVVEADEALVTSLRQQVERRGLVAAGPAIEVASEAQPAPAPDAELLRLVFGEISGLLHGIAVLTPLAADGPGGGFRGAIVRDLMLVEADRATCLADAAALLAGGASGAEPAGEGVDGRELLGRLREKIDVAARLKGVHIEWPDQEWPDQLASGPIAAEPQALATAWSSLLYAYLTLAGVGERVVVHFEVTRVRPAVIFQVALHRRASQRDALSGDAPMAAGPERGAAVSIMLRAVEQCARQHAGRFAEESAGDCLKALMVIPQPLE